MSRLIALISIAITFILRTILTISLKAIISIAIITTVTTGSIRREAGLNLIGLISSHRRP